MKRFFNRRTLALAGVLAATQLLSACVVVPAPYYRPRTVIVEPVPYYDGHYGPGRDHDWRDRR